MSSPRQNKYKSTLKFVHTTNTTTSNPAIRSPKKRCCLHYLILKLLYFIRFILIHPGLQNHRRGDSYFNSDVDAYANEAVVGLKTFDMSSIAAAATATGTPQINLSTNFPCYFVRISVVIFLLLIYCITILFLLYYYGYEIIII